MNFLNILFRTRHELFVVLAILFVGSILIGGNQDRIGLSFVSLNAFFSFLVIAWGVATRPTVNKSGFLWWLLAILLFVAVSTLIRSESIIPIYSTLGNLLFAYAVYNTVNFRTIVLICLYSFILFSIVYLTFYLPGVWRTFGGSNRVSFSGMNPNVVAEFITIGFISGAIFIFSRFNSGSKLWALLFFFVAAVPVLYTVSRKGIFLFLFCTAIAYILKFRKWSLPSLAVFVLAGVALVFVSRVLISSSETDISSQLQERFYETYEGDAETREFLVLTSINKGLEKPIFGHGLESSRDPKFLKSIGLWDDFRKAAVNTHNGFVNLFLKGGLVFVMLHLLIFAYVFKKLFFQIRILPDSLHRDMAILVFIYALIFLAHILSSGNGELFKLGWFLLGLAAGTVRVLEQRMRILARLKRL
jgi:O-antigen ligase